MADPVNTAAAKIIPAVTVNINLVTLVPPWTEFGSMWSFANGILPIRTRHARKYPRALTNLVGVIVHEEH